MLLAAFEGAVDLLREGPGDQPLMRILDIARDAADCPMAMIGARRLDGHHVIASRGIPLANFRRIMATPPGFADLFSKPTIIDDILQHRLKSSGALAQQGWRFVASYPLPLAMLPFPVTLTCADARVDINRPPDMNSRLAECAAIAADEIRMIGDIALQARKLANQSSDIQLIADAVAHGQMPLMLVDQQMNVLAVSPRLAEKGVLPPPEQVGRTLTPSYFGDDSAVLSQVADVIATGEPLSAYRVEPSDDRQVVLVDGFRVESSNGQKFAVLTVTDRTQVMNRLDGLCQHQPESAGVVSDFLLDTLVRQNRLLKRGKIPYHAVARWRSGIKDSQIAALKALKRDPSPAFLNRVADEMASAAGSLFGRSTFRAVTHIPCGNSGPDCLASRLSRLVATRLDVDMIDAFEILPPSGGSHPKSNTRRAPMRLRVKPTDPLLLIDDVATSGSHIEEAATLLSATAPAVLPLVWIGN